MKKIIIGLALATSVFAVDFRVGFGSYDTDFKILNFADHSTSQDTVVFMISEKRSDISDKLFYFYDLEYYTSDNKNQNTKFNSRFPENFSDKANNFIDWRSVNGEYEGFGFDINFGLAYDLFKNENGYLAIAINSGATLPNISADNIEEKAKFAYKIVKKWDLDVGTYKIGLALKRSYTFSDLINFYGSIGYGFQKAYIESDMFKSDIDTTGSYNNFDIGVKMRGDKISSYFSKDLSLSLGFTRKKWSLDSIDVNLFNYFQRDVFRPFELDLESKYTYIGLEYKF